MLSGGRALEGLADARVRQEMSALLDRVPRTANGETPSVGDRPSRVPEPAAGAASAHSRAAPNNPTGRPCRTAQGGARTAFGPARPPTHRRRSVRHAAAGAPGCTANGGGVMRGHLLRHEREDDTQLYPVIELPWVATIQLRWCTGPGRGQRLPARALWAQGHSAAAFRAGGRDVLRAGRRGAQAKQNDSRSSLNEPGLALCHFVEWCSDGECWRLHRRLAIVAERRLDSPLRYVAAQRQAQLVVASVGL